MFTASQSAYPYERSTTCGSEVKLIPVVVAIRGSTKDMGHPSQLQTQSEVRKGLTLQFATTFLHSGLTLFYIQVFMATHPLSRNCHHSGEWNGNLA